MLFDPTTAFPSCELAIGGADINVEASAVVNFVPEAEIR